MFNSKQHNNKTETANLNSSIVSALASNSPLKPQLSSLNKSVGESNNEKTNRSEGIKKPDVTKTVTVTPLMGSVEEEMDKLESDTCLDTSIECESLIDTQEKPEEKTENPINKTDNQVINESSQVYKEMEMDHLNSTQFAPSQPEITEPVPVSNLNKLNLTDFLKIFITS